MAHFAQIDEHSIVTRVIVVEQDVIDSGEFGDPASWVQTSYNTRGGIHYDPNTNTPSEDQSKALRKNYAGIGYTYDVGLDAFCPPRPYPSWELDTQTCLWVSPVPIPPIDPENPIFYVWDEDTLSWVEAA